MRFYRLAAAAMLALLMNIVWLALVDIKTDRLPDVWGQILGWAAWFVPMAVLTWREKRP